MSKLTKQEKQILYNNRVGELVLIYRRRKKLSQEKLGELIDLSRQTIGAIESGLQDITLYHITILTIVLGIPQKEFDEIKTDIFGEGI